MDTNLLMTGAFWMGLVKIIWVNILLSGDNAVVIALAARSLQPSQQKHAIVWGSAAAIVLRVVLTIFAVKLLQLEWLKLIGALLLLWIGVQLLASEDDEADIKQSGSLLGAIKTILIADLVMSLDNVLAVAAAADAAPAEAKLVLLVLGLAMSIPIVIFGSALVLKLMERFPVVITLGAMLLGWIAGEMASSEPVVERWIHIDLILHFAFASVGAALVLVVGRVMNARSAARADGR
ncbi:TerC family protein [Viridibacterium curvum]|uniref:TerC family protein n=1 Tax=Viridibacterium curvum TaxID=1101404 RepID=A0ABP9QBM0_9RHOO